MIHQLNSTLESFKELNFRSGLNILLADKTIDSSDRQSRNSAGKTSVIELIHFLCGARADTTSIFRSHSLSSYSFSLTMDFAGQPITASRSGGTPNNVAIDGQIEYTPTNATLFDSEAHLLLSNDDWKQLLATEWFHLPVEEAEEDSYPSFRSLFSMCVRRQQAGGFLTPTKYFTRQSTIEEQKTIAYLIGLDWTITNQFEKLKVEEKAAKDLRKAMRSGEFGREFGSVAELRSRLTVSEARTRRLHDQIESFEVIPEYRVLEREATDLTLQINSCNTENIADLELIRELDLALQQEELPLSEDLNQLYDEVGIVLPELARKRLDDVMVFHDRIVQNRRSHLTSELDAARLRIQKREVETHTASSRRAQIMAILESGGALDHFAQLQGELSRTEAEVQGLRERLQTGERLERTLSQLKIDRTLLQQALRDDLLERHALIDEAVLLFAELSNELYEQEGSLLISATPLGPKFETHIAGERSRGITNMQMFCFDLMLAILGMQQHKWPGFLIHDSHLFDGVDERQVARALQLGAHVSAEYDFEYIVTLNSDAIPSEGFDVGFDIEDYILDVRLSDSLETGGLFGFRFE